MKKILFFCGILALAMMAISGRLTAEPIDKIVAVVNSDVITEKELGVFIKVAGMELESPAQGNPAEIRQMYLERLVEDRLILQQALKLGFKANDLVIDDRIKQMKLHSGSDKAFEEALKSQGLSLNDLRQKLREQLVVYELIRQQVREKVQVSPKEISEYFEQQRDAYTVPETAIVDSIFVENQEGVTLVQAALAGGKVFSQAAEEFSKKSNIETVYRGQFKKELEDFVFGLTAGKPSEPFKVEGGFYIFLLKEIKPPSYQSFNEVKDVIRQKLEAEKTQKAMRAFVEALKDKAYISLREV